MAFAGCAKTTTSVEYAHAWSQHPGLYLAFNNGIANEAKGKFPSHIQTQTAHAHDYMILGVRRYNDRLTPRLRPNDLDGRVDLLPPVPPMSDLALRRAILQTLNKFLIYSDYPFKMHTNHGLPFQARPHCLPMVMAVIKL